MEYGMFLKRLDWKKILGHLIFLIGFGYFVYLIIFTTKIVPLWDFFPDSFDYILQSKSSLFSSDFYSPKPLDDFDPRPFTIPLFLKLVNSDPVNMVLLQRIMYVLFVFVLISVISKQIINPIIKILLQYSLLLFFLWWQMVGWTSSVVSESLSTSFMFLWFAAILFYYSKPNIPRLIGLIIVSILFSFTRDTWPYIILLFAFLNLLVFVFIDKPKWKINAYFLIFSIGLFFFQNYTSSVGERYKLPVFNSIVGRVSQNHEYMDWFKHQGMPMTEKIEADFKGVDIDSDIGRPFIYQKYEDSTYLPLFNWVLHEGKSVYQKFMLTHWNYFFLKDQTDEQIQRIFAVNLHKVGYVPQPEEIFIDTVEFFPFFTIWNCLLITIITFILFWKTKKWIFIFPGILLFLFAFNSLISYNADALEVHRHLITSQIMIEFISCIGIAFIFDAGLRFVLLKINKPKAKILS